MVRCVRCSGHDFDIKVAAAEAFIADDFNISDVTAAALKSTDLHSYNFWDSVPDHVRDSAARSLMFKAMKYKLSSMEQVAVHDVEHLAADKADEWLSRATRTEKVRYIIDQLARDDKIW
jgi:hypothetical protein